MPILVNNETGLAESLDQHIADQAVAQGTHAIPLNDPNGNPVLANLDQAQNYLQSGYTQPSNDQLFSLLNHAKFSSTGQQIATGLEGAAEAGTFGLSTGVETALGVPEEDIRARRETNPGVHAIGQIGGLAASSLLIPGGGAAGLLSKAGKGASTALGLGAEGAGVASRIAAPAVALAAESALMQGGDEVSKFITNDPGQSTQTAITDIGLSGLLGAGLGGGIGTVPALWRAASGTKLGRTLGAIKDRAQGMGKNYIPEGLEQTIQKSGMDVAPEVTAALTKDPELQSMFSKLQESTTKSGLEAQQSLRQFRNDASNEIVKSFGHTPESVSNLENISEAEAGDNLKKNLIGEIKKRIDPISDKFEKIKSKYSDVGFATEDESALAHNMSVALEQFAESPSSPQFQKISQIIKELPNVKTLEGLRRFQSVHLSDIAGKNMWDVNRLVKPLFRDAEEVIVERRLLADSPELLNEHRAARSAYRQSMDLVEELNDRLHVGKFYSPGGFMKALEEMNPETVLRRLTPSNDASMLKIISERLPEMAKPIRQSILEKALSAATKKAPEGAAINLKSLFSIMDKWSPELQSFLMTPEKDIMASAAKDLISGSSTDIIASVEKPLSGVLNKNSFDKINAIRSLIESLPEKMNPSGTAKTLDALWSKVPAGASGIAALAFGHNPILGAVIGHAGHALTRGVPDAIGLATLRFLASNKPINAGAFKSAVDVIGSMYRAESKINKASKAIFRSGMEVIPTLHVPTEKTREKIKKKVDEYSMNQEKFMDIGGDTGYYLPDHGSYLAATASNVVAYLTHVKPVQERMGPMDPEPVLSQAEKATYDRTLDIAEQPLVVLQNIKDGTIAPQDVIDLKMMYPELYKRLSQKIMDQAMDHIADVGDIPYQTRLGLSLFLDQPLDSTMTSSAIQAAQPKDQRIEPPVDNMAGSKPKNMASLNKMNKLYYTPGQSEQQKKLDRMA